MIMFTRVVPFSSLKLWSHSEPCNSGFSSLSVKTLYILKFVFGVMEVYSWSAQRSCPSGLIMAYNLLPPTLKSWYFVFAIMGFGAIHWSINSALVKASHTNESSALNSLFMCTVLDALSTVKSNSKLFVIFFVFSLLIIICQVH